MRLLTVLLVVLVTACSPVRPRGQIGLIAPEPVSMDLVRLGNERVIGRACFPDGRVDVFSDEPIVREALDKALAQVPGATALSDMRIEDERACVNVSGYPVKMVSGAQQGL